MKYRSPSSDMRRTLSFSALILVVGATVGGASVLSQYRSRLEWEGDHLQELVSTRAFLIEEIAQFEPRLDEGLAAGDARGSTVGRIAAAHRTFQGFGETGVFVLGEWVAGAITRHLVTGTLVHDPPPAIPDAGELMAPMTAALAGNTGTLVGKDYRGTKVLAAFRPLDLAGRPLGLVAKMDHAEVRAPVLRSATRISLGVIGLTLGLSLLFHLFGQPLLQRKDFFTPIIGGEGAAGAVSTFEDVSIRRRHEEALRASEEEYRGLVDHAIHGIYRSNPEGEFLSVNPAFVEMLGYQSQEELLSVDISRDLYPDPEHRAELLRRVEGVDRILGRETQWLKKDGSPIPVRLNGRVIRGLDGGTQAFELIVEDLTERRALESQLRQAQKMEAVGQLTGGIAHDFNNVLGVILLNAEFMTASLVAGKEVELEDVQAIHEAAKRAASITSKLLGFSRKSELEIGPLELGVVVNDISGMLRTLLPERIEFEIDTADSLRPVEADAGAVEQILLNLVTNSRDAIQGRGRVLIQVRDKELDPEYCASHPGMKPGSFVCLEVSDTGKGMDQETRGRIFEPFFTTKDLGFGTGLGMAMVYGLTKQQGGYVSVYSELGKGTATRVYLPLSDRSAHPKPEAHPVHRELRGSSTVLLVEDDHLLRKAGASTLTRHGYRVRVASDGAEALEEYGKHKDEIDLVLSDLGLPQMSGLEVLHRIGELYGPVRFILASGYSGDHLAERETMDPSIKFLRKPWTVEELLSSVRTALEKPPHGA